MAPYLRELVTERCDWSACSARARKELFNSSNARVGVYCERHGILALRGQARDEGL